LSATARATASAGARTPIWDRKEEHLMTDPLADLSRSGVAIWLDDLSRERLASGSLADLAARDHVVGVTTNPTIFAKAISDSGAYGTQMSDLSVRGMERARHEGRDLTSIGSVASFFVSRLDAVVDSRLDKIGTAEAANLRGRAAIANARLAYQHYERVCSSPRWAALRAAAAAAAVGLDFGQRSRLSRHPLRGRSRHTWRGQHDAGGDLARGC